jgi:hypothetical protein
MTQRATGPTTTIYFASSYGDGGLQLVVEEPADEVARRFEDARGAIALTSNGATVYVNPGAVAYFDGLASEGS